MLDELDFRSEASCCAKLKRLNAEMLKQKSFGNEISPDMQTLGRYENIVVVELTSTGRCRLKLLQVCFPGRVSLFTGR